MLHDCVLESFEMNIQIGWDITFYSFFKSFSYVYLVLSVSWLSDNRVKSES